jgi:hypothetical protein
MTTNAVRHCEQSEAIQIKKYNLLSAKKLFYFWKTNFFDIKSQKLKVLK